MGGFGTGQFGQIGFNQPPPSFTGTVTVSSSASTLAQSAATWDSSSGTWDASAGTWDQPGQNVTGTGAVSGRATALTQGLRIFLGGFDFRGSPGYVSDPAGSTYVLQASLDPYPITRNGFVFGWTTGPTSAQGSDRDISNDPRLAGCATSSGVEADFRLDLPAPGDYLVSLALGDALNATSASCQLYDGVNLLDVIATTETDAADSFIDPTGKPWSNTFWPASNQPRKFTFTGTQLILKLGAAGVSSAIAHLFIQTASPLGAGTVTWDAQTGTWDATGGSWDAQVLSNISGNSLDRVHGASAAAGQQRFIGIAADAARPAITAAGIIAQSAGIASLRSAPRTAGTAIERFFGSCTAALHGAASLIAALERFVGSGSTGTASSVSTLGVGQADTWDSITGTWDTTAGTWDQSGSLTFGSGHGASKVAITAQASLRFQGSAAVSSKPALAITASAGFTATGTARSKPASAITALESFRGVAAPIALARVSAFGPATTFVGTGAARSKTASVATALQQFVAAGHDAFSSASAAAGLELFRGSATARSKASSSLTGVERFTATGAAAGRSASSLAAIERMTGIAAARALIGTSATGRELFSGAASVQSKAATSGISGSLFTGTGAVSSKPATAGIAIERFFGSVAAVLAIRVATSGSALDLGTGAVGTRAAVSASGIERFIVSGTATARAAVSAAAVELLTGQVFARANAGAVLGQSTLSFKGAVAVSASGIRIDAQGLRSIIGSVSVAAHAGISSGGIERYVSLATQHFFRVQKEERRFKAKA